MMNLGELSKDFCLGCGSGYSVCECNDVLPFVNVKKAVQDQQAFATLYDALQKARDILHRGIREGERGHKRAIHNAAKVLEVVE